MTIQDYQDWIRRVLIPLSFRSMTDTPGSFLGAAKKSVIVNDTETGLEFSITGIDDHSARHEEGGADEIDVAFLALTFLVLRDTLGSYAGNAGLYTRVKNDESGLEFEDLRIIPAGTRMLFKENSAPESVKAANISGEHASGLRNTFALLKETAERRLKLIK